MPAHTTPHTQTQQNADPAQADLEPNQQAADSGQEEDALLYENMDAQTGGTRAFNANENAQPSSAHGAAHRCTQWRHRYTYARGRTPGHYESLRV
jgi:hypothetical protein